MMRKKEQKIKLFNWLDPFIKTRASRIKIAAGGCCILISYVVICLFALQAGRYGDLSKKADRRVSITIAADTLRGKILDNKGVVLAESLRTYDIGVLKNDVYKKSRNKKLTVEEEEKYQKEYAKRKEILYDVLIEALDLDRKYLDKQWKKYGNFFYAKKGINPLEYEKLNDLMHKHKVQAIAPEASYRRIYPFDGIAKDILGGVTAENLGRSGIELQYDEDLVVKTQKKVVKGKKGTPIYEKGQEEFLNIADLYLTIDALGQQYTESTLKKYAEMYKVQNAFAIVQEPESGRILAAASYPVGEGLSLPMQFTYEPGSTFKTIAVAAGLDTGLIDMNEIFDMENNKWKVSGITIRDHQKKDTLTLSEVLEVSSNIGAGKIAHKLGTKMMYFYLKKFGFGTKTDIAFKGEMEGKLRKPSDWMPIDTVRSGFGYTVSVTGVQLVGAYSAIANGGSLMRPHLVEKIRFADGSEKVFSKPSRIRRVISKETSDKLKKLLINVVEKGTGKQARIFGYTVGGKTGTSEKYQDGKYQRDLHTASFCGFVPVSKPRFTILVVLDEPKDRLQGSASAKIFSEIATKFLTLYAVEPDEELK